MRIRGTFSGALCAALLAVVATAVPRDVAGAAASGAAGPKPPPAAQAAGSATPGDPFPNVDVRDQRTAKVDPKAARARRELDSDLGATGDVRDDEHSGGVAYVGSSSGLLTGPSSASPEEVAIGYVRSHAAAFGVTEADIDALVLVARSVSPDGITHLRYNQVLSGVESFDSGLEAHVTRDGRLITVSGAPAPGARLAGAKPTLTASDAVQAARRHSGGPEGAGEGSGEHASLRWAATADGPVLAWHVQVDGHEGDLYDVLVDARDGSLLRRQALTHDDGLGRYFRSDPDRTPAQTQITMPAAWFDQHNGGTRLWGQNARTYADPNNVDPAPGSEGGAQLHQIPASAGAPSAPDWLYTQSHTFAGATPCPASGCTWNSSSSSSPLVNEKQTSVNAHILTNRFHDHLLAAPIGFDEASGNFQRTNPSGQGLPGDYVQVEVNDGEGLNNANFSTPPDGFAPTMQLYLFDSRDVNGADVAELVYHEYTHGLSNRLVVSAGGGSTLNSFQSSALGEGWSDFYAFDLLVDEGSLADTATSGQLLLGSYLSPNGLRYKPIDCPVDAGGATAACNGAFDPPPSVLGGYTYGDIAFTDNESPHNASEVWSETLWDIRAAVGSDAAQQLVTGGMRLVPDDPSMLDARDAILQQAVAMRSAVGAPNDHYATLWTKFAARGFGLSATTTDADSTTPTQAFDLPTGLRGGELVFTDPGPGGDGDGEMEPGEEIQVHQDITALGFSPVSNIAGSLSSPSSDLQITDVAASWPTLSNGAHAANSDPMRARLAPGQCATRVPVTVTVTSSTGGVVTNAFVDPRRGTSVPVAITDNATASSTFTLEGVGNITDIDLRIDELRHTWVGDLTISLVHAGTTAVVFNPADDFSAQDFEQAIIDDEAPSAMPTSGSGPITGRVRPSGSNALAAFDGKPVAGTWTLEVNDHADNDTGELRRWGLNGPQVTCPAAEYVPVVPKRVLDTRPAPGGQIGYSGGKPADNAVVTLDVTNALSGVPSNAKAVVLNVTGVGSTGGFVTVWPCAAAQPTASNLNVPEGGTAPNLVVVAPDANGNVCLFTNKSIHLLADIEGYFPVTSSYAPVVPKRVLDTRPAPGGQIGYSGGKPADNAVVTLDVTNALSGVPADAKAVVLNVTGVGSTGGFVTVWPSAATQPTASNLNVPEGGTAPNLVVVAPDASGNVCLFTNKSIHLLADIEGYFPVTSSYAPVVPKRVLDTRPAPGGQIGYSGGKPADNAVVTLDVTNALSGVPSNAKAVVLNVTGVGSTGGFVTVWPCLAARPTASNLNVPEGGTAPNLVVVAPDANGNVCLFTNKSIHLLADINGYFPADP